MLRIRSLLGVFMVVLSLGLHVEGPHGHHCILEEAACAGCRSAVTPTAAATPVTDTVECVLDRTFVRVLPPQPVARLAAVLLDAPLRAPPSPTEIA